MLMFTEQQMSVYICPAAVASFQRLFCFICCRKPWPKQFCPSDTVGTFTCSSLPSFCLTCTRRARLCNAPTFWEKLWLIWVFILFVCLFLCAQIDVILLKKKNPEYRWNSHSAELCKVTSMCLMGILSFRSWIYLYSVWLPVHGIPWHLSPSQVKLSNTSVMS